jgi:hypothetical protein
MTTKLFRKINLPLFGSGALQRGLGGGLLLLIALPALAQGPSPSPLYVCEGNGFTLHSTATSPSGQDDVTFTWAQIRTPEPTTPSSTITVGTGTTASTLTRQANQLTDGPGTYVYKCETANSSCTLTSDEYTVVVLASKPAIVAYDKNPFCSPYDAHVEFMIINWNKYSTYTWNPVVGGPGTSTDTGSAGPPGKDKYYLMDISPPGTRKASVTAERTYSTATGTKTCTITSDTVSVEARNSLRVEQSGTMTFCPGEQATFSVKVYDPDNVDITHFLSDEDLNIDWYSDVNLLISPVQTKSATYSITAPDDKAIITYWVVATPRHSYSESYCPNDPTPITLTRGLTVGSITGCICQDTGCTICAPPTP